MRATCAWPEPKPHWLQRITVTVIVGPEPGPDVKPQPVINEPVAGVAPVQPLLPVGRTLYKALQGLPAEGTQHVQDGPLPHNQLVTMVNDAVRSQLHDCGRS